MAKQVLNRVTAALVAVLMVLALVPTNALAATKKTVKSLDFAGGVRTTILKKDTVVKKGTTNLTFAKKSGWITFVAPAKGAYSFTFSNFKCVNKKCQSAVISTYVEQGSYSPYIMNKDTHTYGGYSDALRFCVNGTKFPTKGVSKINRWIGTRTSKVKLKKGQRLYFFVNYDNSSVVNNSKLTAKLVVKKL